MFLSNISPGAWQSSKNWNPMNTSWPYLISLYWVLSKMDHTPSLTSSLEAPLPARFSLQMKSFIPIFDSREISHFFSLISVVLWLEIFEREEERKWRSMYLFSETKIPPVNHFQSPHTPIILLVLENLTTSTWILWPSEWGVAVCRFLWKYELPFADN